MAFVPAPAPASRTAVVRAHPLMEPMYWAVIEVLALAQQLGAVGPNLPDPDALRAVFAGAFEKMTRRAREAGIPQEDVGDAVYALVALIDEQVLRSTWAGAAAWQARPLQLVYFQERTAGEGFFVRVQRLVAQPHRAHVLQVYFLCLAMGFQGRYALSRGEGLGAVLEWVSAHLAPHVPQTDVLSPHGEPPEPPQTLFQREAPLVRLGLAFFGVALLAFVVLRLVLASTVSTTTRPMDDFAAAAESKP